MPPAQLALKALRVAEMDKSILFLNAPLLEFSRFKGKCQTVYFPLNGYTLSDFIIVNGGLFDILSDAPEADLNFCGIDSAQADEAVAMCENNVSSAIAKMDPYIEPTLGHIEALLIGTNLAIYRSRPQLAWRFVSISARLCLDLGLHRHKTNHQDPDDNIKKILFWYTYSFDRGLSLNFGRTPTFSDHDISIEYPAIQSPDTSTYDLHIIWLDLARIQGRIYQKLYSAQGQNGSQEQKTQSARSLFAELDALRQRCSTLDLDPTQLMDTEIFILSNMTVAYRALPTSAPACPLCFADECISIAREALNMHESICARLLNTIDKRFRLYIDWNLLFSPFTPFLVVLGTAILKNDLNDLELLGQVVESLRRACSRASGVKRLYEICRLLFEGAKSCIEQTTSVPAPVATTALVQQPESKLRSTWTEEQPSSTSNTDIFGGYTTVGPENWPIFQSDNVNDMSLLFDDYLVGPESMMGLFDPEISRTDEFS
ncbi:hypothetical protein MBLNU459_g2419t1 [Dothideomycetes sp. NU459]